MNQNSFSTLLFGAYRILEKGSSDRPIKGEVFAMKGLFRMMSVYMGKVYFFFPLGIFMRAFLQVEAEAVHVRP